MEFKSCQVIRGACITCNNYFLPIILERYNIITSRVHACAVAWIDGCMGCICACMMNMVRPCMPFQIQINMHDCIISMVPGPKTCMHSLKLHVRHVIWCIRLHVDIRMQDMIVSGIKPDTCMQGLVCIHYFHHKYLSSVQWEYIVLYSYVSISLNIDIMAQSDCQPTIHRFQWEVSWKHIICNSTQAN